MNPKAELGVDTTDGFASQSNIIKGGGSTVAGALTGKAYFKYFPLYLFKFIATDTLVLANSMAYKAIATAGKFYVAVVNHQNAAVHPGRIGYYCCVTNDGNKLTLDTAGGVNRGRYSGSDDVTNFAQLALSTGAYDAAADSTVTHAAGTSSIYLINERGVPIGHTLFLGKAAARRGYGKHRNNRTSDEREGGFVKDIFVTSVFGQEPCEDAAGRMPGYLVITHAIQYAGVPHPTVTV